MMDTILSILFIIGILAVVVIVRYYIPYKIKADVNAVKKKEISEFRAKLEKELEDTKHQLQLDYAKQNIVFEHQKESFKKIIKAMYSLKDEIHNKMRPETCQSQSNDKKILDDFKNLVVEESLYIGQDCYKALILFHGLAVTSYLEEKKEIMRAINNMEMLYKRILQYCQFRIGVETEGKNLLDYEELKKSLKT